MSTNKKAAPRDRQQVGRVVQVREEDAHYSSDALTHLNVSLLA
jgi:hypothetical protein